MPTLPLSTVAQVALDSDGSGSVSTGPVSQGEVWSVASVAVYVQTNDNEATCQVFMNGYLADVALWGSTGSSSSNVSGTVNTGQQIQASWVGGDPGSTAYLSVFGTRTI